MNTIAIPLLPALRRLYASKKNSDQRSDTDANTKNSDSRNIILRFTLGGFLFGLMFPLGSWMFCFWINDLTFFTGSSIVEIHTTTPLHYVVDTAPFVLCAVAFLIGRNVDRHNQIYIRKQKQLYQQQKQILKELKSKNKKIADSINYAKRIQNSIVPQPEALKQHFPEIMMYFRPKDVVSGDFPWYSVQGDNVYLAAVDCTGHGVPGAMMSMVGYFLMNNILNIHPDISPADLLTQLADRVKATFSQQSDMVQTMDGMDISLVKVNTRANTLTFAGAHRPLYLIQNNELQVIKGSRRSIGGHPRTEKHAFIDHTLYLDQIDAIFMFSDGVQDQYSEDMSKYSISRLKGLVEEKGTLPLDDFAGEVERSLKEWRGNANQTDDMLMVGVRFGQAG